MSKLTSKHPPRLHPSTSFRRTMVVVAMLGASVMPSFASHETLKPLTKKATLESVWPTYNNNPRDRDHGITIDLLKFTNGELGNHFGHLLKALEVKKFVEDYFANSTNTRHHKLFNNKEMQELPLRVQLHYKTQNKPKSIRTAQELNTCFPNFASENFQRWNRTEYARLNNAMQEWKYKLGNSSSSVSQQFASYEPRLAENATFDDILSKMWEVLEAHRHNLTERFDDEITFPYIEMDKVSRILTSDGDFLRSAFNMNESNPHCCGHASPSSSIPPPYPDETVLHIRGLTVEHATDIALNKRISHIVNELTPNQTAYDLLGHLPPGSKVAIIARYPRSEPVKETVQMLQTERKFQVRLVEGQTGIQDFCFLMKAKQMAGQKRSTYFVWAARLGAEVERVDEYVFREVLVFGEEDSMMEGFNESRLTEKLVWETKHNTYFPSAMNKLN